MAIKFVDSAVPIGDFPVAFARDIDFEDGESLQDKLINGSLVPNLDQYPTTTEMEEAIAAAEHLKRQKVDALPDVGAAEENVIYMVPKADAAGDQSYDEYMLLDGALEKIGDTAVDLTGYATEEYVDLNALVLDQGIDNAGKVPKVGDDGIISMVDVAAMGGDAESTAYNNADYPAYTNVDLALDAILAKINYVKPQITSFTMTPAETQYEKGQSVDALDFAWQVNKPITSQSLTDCVIEVDDRAASFTGPITATKSFTLTVGDGTETAKASKTISFLDKAYYGSAAEPGAYDSAFILGLPDSKFATGKKGTYSMNIATGEYGYWAIPAAFGDITTFWAFGFEADATDCGSVEFTNASGYTSTYKVFRTGQKGLGSVSVEVK